MVALRHNSPNFLCVLDDPPRSVVPGVNSFVICHWRTTFVFPDLVAIVGVVDEPLFVDFVVFLLAFFIFIFSLVTYCDVVPFTVMVG